MKSVIYIFINLVFLLVQVCQIQPLQTVAPKISTSTPTAISSNSSLEFPRNRFSDLLKTNSTATTSLTNSSTTEDYISTNISPPKTPPKTIGSPRLYDDQFYQFFKYGYPGSLDQLNHNRRGYRRRHWNYNHDTNNFPSNVPPQFFDSTFYPFPINRYPGSYGEFNLNVKDRRRGHKNNRDKGDKKDCRRGHKRDHDKSDKRHNSDSDSWEDKSDYY